MAQPQLARITCSVCNGWYNSESEYATTCQTRFIAVWLEQSTLQHGVPNQIALKINLARQKKNGPNFCTV